MRLNNDFKKVLPYLTLVIFGFLLYYQTLFFSFVYLDDNQLIINNGKILNDSGLVKIFTSDVFLNGQNSGFYYRPVLNLSFLLDYKIGELNPFYFHFTNLALHLVAACLVFLLFSRHLFPKLTSYFLAFIFLVHPALSQVVSWIPGRNDSLLAIFTLTAFLLFLNFLRTDKLAYLWGHLAFFCLALFVKESAIFLPLICLIYYFLFDDKFSRENRNNNFLITFTLWFSALIIWYLFRRVSLPTDIGLNGMLLVGWHNVSTILVYFGKAILPVNLGVYPTVESLTIWFGLLAVILVGTAVYFTKNLNWRRFSFGFLWFIIFLLPALLNSDPSLEHRLYLPIIGILICVAEVYPVKNIDWQDKRTRIIALAVVMLFSILTVIHSNNFSGRLSFWTEAAKNSPNSAFVHNNLGAMYYLDGNFSKAKEQYQIALNLDPAQGLVHNNLGLIAFNNKDFKEAEAEYRAELAINPYYDNAFVNLGLLYVKLNRLSDARDAFEQAYFLNPNNYQAYNNLLILRAN